MSITTYINAHQNIGLTNKDQDLIDLLYELNCKTEGGWIVQGIKTYNWVMKYNMTYCLYYRLSGIEYQIICLGPGIVTHYPKIAVMAYILGYLEGLK